jgi:hypothetical protein
MEGSHLGLVSPAEPAQVTFQIVPALLLINISAGDAGPPRALPDVFLLHQIVLQAEIVHLIHELAGLIALFSLIAVYE